MKLLLLALALILVGCGFQPDSSGSNKATSDSSKAAYDNAFPGTPVWFAPKDYVGYWVGDFGGAELWAEISIDGPIGLYGPSAFMFSTNRYSFDFAEMAKAEREEGPEGVVLTYKNEYYDWTLTQVQVVDN